MPSGWGYATTSSTASSSIYYYPTYVTMGSTSGTSSTVGTVWYDVYGYGQTTPMYHNQIETYRNRPVRQELRPSDIRRAVVAEHAAAVDGHSDESKQRARENLLSHLSPKQRKTFKRNRWFIVEGGKTGQRYRVRANDHVVANIDVLDDKNKVTHRLCGHCSVREIPMDDQYLAQKYMLEADEEEFLKIANRHAA